MTLSYLDTLPSSVSSLTQTVNSITLSVSNGESSSTIKLLRDGVVVSSKSISFSGMVTFSDLSTAGQTHLCSLFYEVNRVNYLLAKIEELPALDNVRFSLK